MKIGLLNFHYAYNYGAVLQCLALLRTLEKMGHEPIVVNYRPYYQRQYYLPYPDPFRTSYIAWKKLKKEAFPKRMIFPAKWFVHTVLNYGKAGSRKKLKWLFEPFADKYIPQTKVYLSPEKLRKDAGNIADAYICGSDQIWNPDVTWGIDRVYYLDIGTGKKKIAYAVSPCGLDCDKYADEIRSAASGLDHISLREREKLAELSRVLGRDDITVCPDPTVFPEAGEYAVFEEDITEKEGSYILMYGFDDRDGNKLLTDTATEAGRHFGLPVIDISLDDICGKNDDIRRVNVTPGQFLKYIGNARYVVTNSFHATVFSIIYRKDFCAAAKSGTSARVTELLDTLGLSGRIIGASDEPTYDTDYSGVSEKIEAFRQKGIDFLKKALD